MKILETRFTSDGFDHVQIARKGNLAIYQRTKTPYNKTITHFEVVVIRVSEEWTAFGQTFPESEKYPNAKEWGTFGWTYDNLEAAWDRLWDLRNSKPHLSKL